MANAAAFTWQELVEITQGTWLRPPPATPDGITSVVDDSRQATPGALFVAIRGEVDAHFNDRITDTCISWVTASMSPSIRLSSPP